MERGGGKKGRTQRGIERKREREVEGEKERERETTRDLSG